MQLFQHELTVVLYFLKNIVGLNVFQHRECSCTTQRTFLKRKMPQRNISGYVVSIARDNTGHRNDACTQSFPKANNIWFDSIMFKGKHFSGTSKGNRYLVKNEQYVVTRTDLPHLRPISLRWNLYVCISDRFHEERADVTFFFDDIFKVVGVSSIITGATAVKG